MASRATRAFMPRLWGYLDRCLEPPAPPGLARWLARHAPEEAQRMRAPRTAMVLAAGLGRRMRPLTDDKPKALVEVGGKAMIDHMLDRLAAAGVKRVVVNVHAFADALEAHLVRRNDLEISISDEREALLETGGALKKARPLAGRGADPGRQYRFGVERGRGAPGYRHPRRRLEGARDGRPAAAGAAGEEPRIRRAGGLRPGRRRTHCPSRRGRQRTLRLRWACTSSIRV